MHQSPGSDDEISFLLIKPDGRREPRLADFLADFECLSGPREDLDVRLTPEAVGRFWYRYPESHRPVAAEVLRAFIAYRSMRAFVVRAPAAIRLVDQVKSEVRRAFGTGPFSNLVHAPDSPDECAVQLPILRGELTGPAQAVTGLIRWPLPAPAASLKAAAAAAVAVVEDQAVPSGGPVRFENGSHALRFVHDKQKCLDHAVHMLLREVRDLSLERAVTAVICPEGSPHQVVATGDRAWLSTLQRRLGDEDVFTSTT
jgi:hypothetical protein